MECLAKALAEAAGSFSIAGGGCLIALDDIEHG
jgi:hypothetical protein